MKLALADATGGTGKIGNFTIDFVPLDDATAAAGKWDADQEKANANKAANDADAMLYLGTFNSGAAKISIPILNQAGIAMISPANTYTGLTTSVGAEAGEPDLYYPTKVRNYFRVIGNDALQGPADAEFLKSLGNIKSVYILDDGEAYGKGIADTTAAGLKAQGIAVAARVTINGKAPDYKSQAADIKAKNPDAIFYGGITQNQAGKLVGDIRAAGIKVPFLGPDGINEDAFIKDAGAAGEGVYSSVGGLPDDKLGPKALDFVTRYKAKYGSTQAYTIYGYETMNVALAAIKKAGVKDRKAILSALQNLGEFDGVLGKWSFDKNGDTTLGDFIVTQVKDGKWVQVSYIRPKPLS
jgi:branched-chain amino acid transport system substrate-binding protein